MTDRGVFGAEQSRYLCSVWAPALQIFRSLPRPWCFRFLSGVKLQTTSSSPRLAFRQAVDQRRPFLRGRTWQRGGALLPEETSDHDEGFDVRVGCRQLPQQGHVVESLVVMQEGNDTQSHRANQENPVTSHFHPEKQEREKLLDRLLVIWNCGIVSFLSSSFILHKDFWVSLCIWLFLILSCRNLFHCMLLHYPCVKEITDKYIWELYACENIDKSQYMWRTPPETLHKYKRVFCGIPLTGTQYVFVI